MTIVYLLRHGEYKNPLNILPLRMLGFPLNIKGINQAKTTAKYLKDKKIQLIFSSPILRCSQTAKIIAQELRIKVHYSSLISEVKSPFEGMLMKRFNQKGKDLYQHPYHLKYGGEKWEEVYKRMIKFLIRILNKYKDKNILVVSHGDPIMSLIYGLAEKDLNKYFNKTKAYIPKGGLAKMEFRKDKLINYKQVNY